MSDSNTLLNECILVSKPNSQNSVPNDLNLESLYNCDGITVLKLTDGWEKWKEMVKHQHEAVQTLEPLIPQAMQSSFQKMKSNSHTTMLRILDQVAQNVKYDAPEYIFKELLDFQPKVTLQSTIQYGNHDNSSSSYGRKDLVIQFKSQHPLLQYLCNQLDHDDANSLPMKFVIDFKHRQTLTEADYKKLDEAILKSAEGYSGQVLGIMWNWHELDVDCEEYEEYYKAHTLNRTHLLDFIIVGLYQLPPGKYSECIKKVMTTKSRKRKKLERCIDATTYRQIDLKVGNIVFDYLKSNLCLVLEVTEPLQVVVLTPTDKENWYKASNCTTKLHYEHLLKSEHQCIFKIVKYSCDDGYYSLQNYEDVANRLLTTMTLPLRKHFPTLLKK